MATGRWSEADHNGDAFLNETLAAQRGFNLAGGKCGAVCEFRADLLELGSSLGLKTWPNPEHP
eukprot:9480178-Pyramimonas_sp.AAC.1